MALVQKTCGPSRFRFRRLLRFPGANIHLDREPCTDYERRVDTHALKLVTSSLMTAVVILVSVSFALVGPLYAFVAYGEYSIPSGTIMPFVDAATGRGVLINLFVQSITTVGAVVALICSEIAACVLNNTYMVMADLICFNLDKFSDGLRQGHFSLRNAQELLNIFLQLQDLETYVSEVNNIYYWKLFTQPLMTTGCVALAVFAQLQVSFR